MPAMRVNGKHFATKADAISYYNQILKQYNIGDPIEGDYKLDVIYLFAHHPQAPKKAPYPIFDIVCAIHPEYKTTCFKVISGYDCEDGSIMHHETFSHRSCISNFNHFKIKEREESIRINPSSEIFKLIENKILK
jgi:hypothetical protein